MNDMIRESKERWDYGILCVRLARSVLELEECPSLYVALFFWLAKLATIYLITILSFHTNTERRLLTPTNNRSSFQFQFKSPGSTILIYSFS